MEYTHYETGEIISREQYIVNGLARGELLVREKCGCVVIQDRTADAYIVYCPKHEAAPELYEALKDLPEPKSILAEAAYTGGDIPKKWMNDRGHFIDGYNQALKEVAKRREQALAEAEGK